MSIDEIDLIILAGGLGTRLRPVLQNGQPKAMADIESRPFIDHLLDWLYQSGIRKITLALGYGADPIIQHLSQLSIPEDLTIQQVIEPSPLGTGGAIRYALDNTSGESVFIVNGDTIAVLDMASMLHSHINSNADISMALATVDDCSRFGSVKLNNEGYIESFIEKSECTGSGLVNAGVYLANRDIISALPANTALSWEQDCLPEYCDGRMAGLLNCDRFLDMGTPEALSYSPAFIHSLQG